jgi:hypothetical protein
LARTVGDSSLTDKAKALIDGNMVLVTKAGDRNIDLLFAICYLPLAAMPALAGSSGQTSRVALPAFIAASR